MSIDPKVTLIVKLVLTVLNLVANGTISFAGLVTPQTATTIAAACQVLITLLTALMTAYSSSAPGPLAPADPPIVQAAARLASLPPESNLTAVQGAKAAVQRAVDNHVN